MGKIIQSKRTSENKIQCKVELSEFEAQLLQGAVNNINIFCDNCLSHKAKIIKRGRKKSTQYFEIPFDLRFRKNLNQHKSLTYQKIETTKKGIYIYVIKKELFNF